MSKKKWCVGILKMIEVYSKCSQCNQYIDDTEKIIKSNWNDFFFTFPPTNSQLHIHCYSISLFFFCSLCLLSFLRIQSVLVMKSKEKRNCHEFVLKFVDSQLSRQNRRFFSYYIIMYIPSSFSNNKYANWVFFKYKPEFKRFSVCEEGASERQRIRGKLCYSCIVWGSHSSSLSTSLALPFFFIHLRI